METEKEAEIMEIIEVEDKLPMVLKQKWLIRVSFAV